MPDWKEPAIPRHVAQALVVDTKHRFLIIHRSENCKSAANVWSLPSGTHEIGETATDCMYRELMEEFSLEARLLYLAQQYENIAGDPTTTEQYHWVITVFIAVVDSLEDISNNEPDRHDQVTILPLSVLKHGLETFLNTYKFHPSLSGLFRAYSDYLFQGANHGIEDYLENIVRINPPQN